MSRGIGSLQRDILDRIRSKKNTSTLESLRWELSEEPDEVANLSKSSTYAIERAVRSLAKRELLSIEPRPLATLQEWIDHYPSKTHQGDIRQMRLNLLPVLVEWVRSDEGPRPLYSSDENERFFARGEGGSLATRLNSVDRGIKFKPEWKLLEPQLRQHLAKTDSDSLFYLIARGKHLFTHASIQIRFSFGELIDRCATENILPESLITQLRSLADRFLPREQVGALELKSVIYRFITSVVHGHPDLKSEAFDALHKACPEYLSTLSGFTPPAKRKSRGLWIQEIQGKAPIKKESILSRLIDQTTFHKFKFLRLPNIASNV